MGHEDTTLEGYKIEPREPLHSFDRVRTQGKSAMYLEGSRWTPDLPVPQAWASRLQKQ